MTTIYGEGSKYPVTANFGGHMETQVWLDTENGHCEAITHTWTNNWAAGFTGAVGLVFYGAENRPLSHSQPESFGVDARSIFWKASSRTDSWSYDMDPSISSQVASITVIHTHAPKDRLGDILNDITSFGKSIFEYCEANPEVCREIGGLF